MGVESAVCDCRVYQLFVVDKLAGDFNYSENSFDTTFNSDTLLPSLSAGNFSTARPINNMNIFVWLLSAVVVFFCICIFCVTLIATECVFV